MYKKNKDKKRDKLICHKIKQVKEDKIITWEKKTKCLSI